MKTIVLSALTAFVVLTSCSNGPYQRMDDNAIIDTRTGIVYKRLYREKEGESFWIISKTDYTTGEQELFEIEPL